MQRSSTDSFVYDASRAPDPATWSALTEAELLLAIIRHHTTDPPPHLVPPSVEAHATTHLAVESQLAANDPPEAKRALGRLLSEGLGRHDAVHAIATLFANRLWAQAQEGDADFDKSAYVDALDALDVKTWRELTGDESYSPPAKKRKDRSKRKKRKKKLQR
jgi:hypothetical protein